MVYAVQFLCSYIKGTSFIVRTDHNALKWMLKCKDINEVCLRWRLRLSEFDYEVLYPPGLVHQESEASSRLLHSSNTPDCHSIDNKISLFESSPVALE